LGSERSGLEEVMHGSGYRKHKRDATHSEISTELLALGASVLDNSAAGDDAPDLFVGFCRRNFWVEAKSDKTVHHQKGDGRTDGQRRFAAEWRGEPPVVLKSRAEAREWYLRTRHELCRQSERLALAELPRCAHRTPG
jgi:hypothetical protein